MKSHGDVILLWSLQNIKINKEKYITTQKHQLHSNSEVLEELWAKGTKFNVHV